MGKITPQIDLELSIKALEVYQVEPAIINSMLKNLNKVVKQSNTIMDVKIEHRKRDIEYLRMACNLSGLDVDYAQADLMDRVLKRLDKLKGQFSIHDGVVIYNKWKKDWEKYFKEQFGIE